MAHAETVQSSHVAESGASIPIGQGGQVPQYLWRGTSMVMSPNILEVMSFRMSTGVTATVVCCILTQILCVVSQKASASGDFVPQTTYRSSAPGPRWGPQTTSLLLRPPIILWDRRPWLEWWCCVNDDPPQPAVLWTFVAIICRLRELWTATCIKRHLYRPTLTLLILWTLNSLHVFLQRHLLTLTVFSARCNIYISRLCYDVSVRLSVRLSALAHYS